MGPTGRIFVPLQNLQDTRVKAPRGAVIGTIEPLFVVCATDAEAVKEVGQARRYCAQVVEESVLP